VAQQEYRGIGLSILTLVLLDEVDLVSHRGIDILNPTCHTLTLPKTYLVDPTELIALTCKFVSKISIDRSGVAVAMEEEDDTPSLVAVCHWESVVLNQMAALST
jgi:hypothetical protein